MRGPAAPSERARIVFHPLNHRDRPTDRPTKAIYLSAAQRMRREERGRPVNISRFESSRHVQSMISGSPSPSSASSTLSLDHGKQMRRDTDL